MHYLNWKMKFRCLTLEVNMTGKYLDIFQVVYKLFKIEEKNVIFVQWVIQIQYLNLKQIMFFNKLHRFNISTARIKWRWNREFHRKVCHLAIPIPFHILRNYSTFSNIKENIPLVVISDYQDDAAIPEDIVIDSKNYYYLGNIKAWIQSGGKIEYPKIINYQVIMNYKMENCLL